LPLEIGLRAFRDRSRDFLHAGIARIGGHQARYRDSAIDDRQQTAKND